MTWSRGLYPGAWMALFSVLIMTPIASASEIDGKKGIGYSRAIGGPHGLAFKYGINRLAVEAIVGFSRFSYVNNDPAALVNFAASLGGHFQLLSAEHASFTVGTRFNLGTGSVRATEKVGSEQYQDVTQFGIDLPLRVYWFPDTHISIHTEFGAAFLLGAQDGLLFGANDGDAALAPEGLAIIVFRHSAPIGQLGLTFWW